MLKKLMCLVFGATFALGVSATEMLADMHEEMGGCETCHADGMPSDDGAFEAEQCATCHGGMDEMGEPHPHHSGMLECTDCHQPHDQTLSEKPTCDACHDDGR